MEGCRDERGVLLGTGALNAIYKELVYLNQPRRVEEQAAEDRAYKARRVAEAMVLGLWEGFNLPTPLKKRLSWYQLTPAMCAQMSDRELMKRRGVGPKTLDQIRAAIGGGMPG